MGRYGDQDEQGAKEDTTRSRLAHHPGSVDSAKSPFTKYPRPFQLSKGLPVASCVAIGCGHVVQILANDVGEQSPIPNTVGIINSALVHAGNL